MPEYLFKSIEYLDWNAVAEIQLAAYGETLVERIDILRQKSLVARQCCFMAFDKLNGSSIGYVLAHPYPSNQTPSLDAMLELDSIDFECCENLFLHDFALRSEFKGKGFGLELMQLFIERVKQLDFSSITLVAVQSSHLFWSKLGFKRCSINSEISSYGVGAVFMKRVLE